MATSRLMVSFSRLLASCCVLVSMLLAMSQAAFSGSGTPGTRDGTIPYSGACPYVCTCPPGDRIHCFGDETVETISFQAFGLTELPEFDGEFSSLQTIDLSDNVLINIPRGAFNEDTFPSLIEVYLQHNYIANLERSAFDTGDIEVVDLSNNLLQEVRLSSFDLGDNFRELNLQDNFIESVVLDGTRLDRENYPALTISLSGNSLPCDVTGLTPQRLQTSPYVPLCRDNFIENDGATCVPPNSLPILLTQYCELVLSALPPPQTQEPPPETREPPPETREPPPETQSPSPTSNGGGESSGQSVSLGVIVGSSVAVIIVVLMVMVTVLIIVCLCLKFKMWERKEDSVAISQIEERLLTNKLNTKPYEYNKFLPLTSPSGPIPSPRYVSIPKSPLPPIPGYPPGFPALGGLPGPGGGTFPRLQEQGSGNPDSEDIYESIDGSLFEEYESSYIYRVESVPDRPANMANVPFPNVPKEAKEPISSDHESDTASVSVTVVEAEVFVNHATDVDTLGGPVVIRAEVHTSAAPTEIKALKSEQKSQVSEKQPSENVIDSQVAPPIAEENLDLKPLSIETKLDIEDIEEVQTANTAKDSLDKVSATEESSGSSAKQKQSQTLTPPEDCSDSCTPTTQIVNADNSKGNNAETAQNSATTEREKRLTALKDAWESQDKEDVAYLKIVL